MQPTLSDLPTGSSIADAHLALAMEAVGMGAWHWDIKTGAIHWSTSLERLHGLEPGTFPGTFDGYQQYIHPEDRERVLTTIARSVEDRQPHYLHYRIVLPGGDVRWLEARGRLFTDAAGQPERLVGVCMDVTAKQEYEDQRRLAQRRQHEAEAALQDQNRLALLSRDVSLALTRESDIHVVLQRCAEAVVVHLGAAFARIWTYNAAEHVLELQSSAGLYTHVDGPHGRVPVGQFKIGLIAEERRAHLTNDVQHDPRVGDHDWARREQMVAFAGYPLLIGDGLVGVLAMFARHPLSEADFNGLGTVANALAVGIARARADREIRESEQRYRFLADAAPTQVWTTDGRGTLDYANSQARTYFGADPAAMPPDERAQIVHPDDRAAAGAGWAQAIATGQPLETEYRLRRQDGEYRWHIVRGQPFRDSSGQVTKWFGTNTDIHDFKLVRLALAARADELARTAADLQYHKDLTTTITNNTASALFMMGTDGHPIFMNAAASEMTGYASLDEIADRPLHDAIHFLRPDGSPYPMEECPIDRANAEIAPLRAQREVFCRKNGSLFPVEYNVAPITRDGRPLGAVIEVREITAALEAERALRESDDRFHLLARATNDVIWDWDLDHDQIWWNENFASAFGFSLAELESGPSSWTSRIHPDDHARVTSDIHTAIDGDAQTWSDEYRFRRRDGSYAIVFDRGIVVRDNAGRARRMMGSMMDISERKRVEAELRRQADHLAALAAALQRSNRDLDQFAYVASHDLKAPLRGIANLSQWIEEDLGPAVPEGSREHLRLLRNRVQRMESLIDGVLAYSRAGRTSEDAKPVSVRRLVRDVIELVAPAASIQFEVDEDLPTLRTHRVLLQQVFMNLITNAVKYGAAASDSRIRVSARAEHGHHEFAVADNGPGIDPGFHEKIWGIFQTLHPRDEIEGTGIGLSLVKKIVEGRGGRVWVESGPGAGATFRFTWPDAPDAES